MRVSHTFRDELLSAMAEIQTVDCHSHTSLRRDYYESVPHDLFEQLVQEDKN